MASLSSGQVGRMIDHYYSHFCHQEEGPSFLLQSGARALIRASQSFSYHARTRVVPGGSAGVVDHVTIFLKYETPDR